MSRGINFIGSVRWRGLDIHNDASVHVTGVRRRNIFGPGAAPNEPTPALRILFRDRSSHWPRRSIVVGFLANSAHAYRKNANGAWTLVRQTEPQPDEFCENEDARGSSDVSGNANIVYTWPNELFPRGSARIFEGPYGMANTPVMIRLLAPPGTVYDLWDPVAIDLPSALTSGEPNNGAYAFTRAICRNMDVHRHP